jgi:hypothetical protein
MLSPAVGDDLSTQNKRLILSVLLFPGDRDWQWVRSRAKVHTTGSQWSVPQMGADSSLTTVDL